MYHKKLNLYLVNQSKEVVEFAKQFDDNTNRQNAISLAFEELGTFILNLSAGRKKNYIFEMDDGGNMLISPCEEAASDANQEAVSV